MALVFNLMPKVDLLSKEEAALAKSQGWGLHYVFGLPAKRWALEVLPVQFTEKVGAAQAQAQETLRQCAPAIQALAPASARRQPQCGLAWHVAALHRGVHRGE